VYRKGHYGVALLVFAPVGFSLVRAGAPDLAFLTGAIMLSFAMLPDVDLRVPLLTHRGATHTLAFGALVGGAFALVASLAGEALGLSPGGVLGRVGLAGFGFAVGALTVGAHLLADVLTPSGVALFWPLSRRRYTLSLAPARSPVANYVLFAVGIGAVAAATWLAVTL